MNGFGDKNMRNLILFNIVLILFIWFILFAIAISIINNGFVSFLLMLSHSFMLTLFYELFKVAIDKSNHIVKIYEDYYNKTILNETTLDILNLQITNLLKLKKINVPSLLYYVNQYHQLLNYNIFYDDVSLMKFNSCIKKYVADVSSKKNIKKITVELLNNLYLINGEAKNYLYKYYDKSKRISNC